MTRWRSSNRGNSSPSAAVSLFRPITTAQGRRAVNPLTGEILPALYIGRLVPNSGNFTNGMVVYEGTPQQRSPFRAAPRLGFAWDVTGDGRTAVRGGAGVFYDRYSDDNILDLIELPPVLNTYRANYTTIQALLSSPLTATPTAVRRIEEFVPPVVYNWSLGVQREIGWNLVGDVAYVGNAARDQRIDRQINGRTYGYAYQPSSLDSTNVSGGQAQPLPDDLLRPSQGYGGITERTFLGYSDYHSMQFSVNRRRSSDGLSVGAAYTYQMSNKTLGAIDPFVAGQRREELHPERPAAAHAGGELLVPGARPRPEAGQRHRQSDLRQLADLGHHDLHNGTYGGFTYSYTAAPTGALTGTGAINAGGSRVIVTCDPNLPRGERTFERQFRTECIAPPTDQFRLGTALNDEYLGPGYMNWDISVFKHIPMGGTRRLQLRAELYNAFNSDQWTGVNTAAQFNYATGALTNPNVFGRLNGNTQQRAPDPARRAVHVLMREIRGARQPLL